MSFKEIRDRFNVKNDTLGENSLNSIIYHIAKIEKENETLKRKLETDRKRFQVYANLAQGLKNELKEYKKEKV